MTNATVEFRHVSKKYGPQGPVVDLSLLVPAGDICVLAGCETPEIGDTFAAAEDAVPMQRISVEKPTLGMLFSVNTSPLSGTEGEAIQHGLEQKAAEFAKVGDVYQKV